MLAIGALARQRRNHRWLVPGGPHRRLRHRLDLRRRGKKTSLPQTQPVAPKPQPVQKRVVKKLTICHNGRNKKVTKKQLQALRKKAAKAKKGAKPKIKPGACKKKPKKRR
jgi:hypothetical protein